MKRMKKRREFKISLLIESMSFEAIKASKSPVTCTPIFFVIKS